MATYTYHYRLTHNEEVVNKIKIFLNCTEEEANDRWNSFMENHNYSGTVKLIDVKTK